MADGTSLELVLPSEIKLIDVVHSASERMAELAGFDSEEALNIGLAVREAVINAMLHGNHENPELDVRVRLTAGVQGLEASVRDYGEGFDPGQTPDPRDGDNRLLTSGRGLLLMRAFVDDVLFDRPDGGGTQVTLTKRHAGDAD